MTETVTIPTFDGNASFNAYVARPAGTPRAAITGSPDGLSTATSRPSSWSRCSGALASGTVRR